MRVLIVKLSSLGDVIHTLPELTDARAACTHITFDLLVEESLAEVPAWHPAVHRVLPVALRRWRKEPLGALARGEVYAALTALRRHPYELVMDAQGLLKSAAITCLARGRRAGLDRQSAREAPASWVYQERYAIARGVHAVTRTRRLFGLALGYTPPDGVPDYGLRLTAPGMPADRPYLVFIHGTAWRSKEWPARYWKTLAEYAVAAGYPVKLPWGDERERARAATLAQVIAGVEVLPALALRPLAETLAGAAGAVAVDTGLAHLAAALAVPCVTLYGASDPTRTGTLGRDQIRLAAAFPCAPCLQRHCRYQGASTVTPACYAEQSPLQVWQALGTLMNKPSAAQRILSIEGLQLGIHLGIGGV